MLRQSSRTVTKIEQHLILLAWLNHWLGYEDTRELLADLNQVEEGFAGDGRSYIFARLITRSNFDANKRYALEIYDSNIQSALVHMNKGRTLPITLRYFQYLAALYTEIYLDYRWNYSDKFLNSLNEFIKNRELDSSHLFVLSDLDKIAFWMATGSGKTLLLHLNFRQFLHYNREPLDNISIHTKIPYDMIH